MTETVMLEFISRQLERVLAEVIVSRNEVELTNARLRNVKTKLNDVETGLLALGIRMQTLRLELKP